jgi:hypothetical protein
MGKPINTKAVSVSAKNQTRKQMLNEVSMQTNALLQLVRWRNNLVIFSALCLVLSYCGFTGTIIPFAAGVVCLIAAVLGMAAAVAIYCSIRHGRKNVARIKKLAEKK